MFSVWRTVSTSNQWNIGGPTACVSMHAERTCEGANGVLIAVKVRQHRPGQPHVPNLGDAMPETVFGNKILCAAGNKRLRSCMCYGDSMQDVAQAPGAGFRRLSAPTL